MDSYFLLFVRYFGACAIICWNQYCLVLHVPSFVGFIHRLNITCFTMWQQLMIGFIQRVMVPWNSSYRVFIYLQTALWTAWAVPHQQTVLIAMTPPTSKWVPVSPTVGRASIRIPTPDSAQVKSMINQIATNLFQFHAQFEDVCSDCSFLQPITIGLLYKFWDRSRCNREGELEFLAIWSPCLIQTRQKMTFSW